jgi:very-short-patch-repair endonuclease
MHAQRTNERSHGAVVLRQLADRQHGVVTRTQLLQANFGVGFIGWAVRAGRLQPLYRGVYAVGHTALRRQGWWMAALLACGEGAALSHRTAAQAWRLTDGSLRPIELTVPCQGGRKRDGLRIHRTRLHPSEVVTLDGLRTTTPARTIADLAARLDRRSLRRLIERAQDLRRFDPAAIQPILERRAGRPGCRLLRDLIDLHQPDVDRARTRLERLFLRLVRSARLPKPQVNVHIAGAERDFAWPAQRLVVEADGYAYHSSRAAMRRDRRRDRELTAAGWRPIRFTYEEVVFEPDAVARELAALLSRPAPTAPLAARSR